MSIARKKIRSRRESYRARVHRLRSLWIEKDRLDRAINRLEDTFTVGQIARLLKRGVAA